MNYQEVYCMLFPPLVEKNRYNKVVITPKQYKFINDLSKSTGKGISLYQQANITKEDGIKIIGTLLAERQESKYLTEKFINETLSEYDAQLSRTGYIQYANYLTTEKKRDRQVNEYIEEYTQAKQLEEDRYDESVLRVIEHLKGVKGEMGYIEFNRKVVTKGKLMYSDGSYTEYRIGFTFTEFREMLEGGRKYSIPDSRKGINLLEYVNEMIRPSKLYVVNSDGNKNTANKIVVLEGRGL